MQSLHDYYLVSYEVKCEKREITLSFRKPNSTEGDITHHVIFEVVQGYLLKHDAFGNIVSSLHVVPLDKFLSDHWTEISGSYRQSGAPGPWAQELPSGHRLLSEQGVKAFILASSYGLNGWILAREAQVIQTPGK
jgi:hypothetical protein